MAIAYSDAQRSVGSVATYSCTTYGYVGDAVRTCLADGSWGGAAPTTLRPRQALPIEIRFPNS